MVPKRVCPARSRRGFALACQRERNVCKVDEPDFFLGHRRSLFHESWPTNTIEAGIVGRGWHLSLSRDTEGMVQLCPAKESAHTIVELLSFATLAVRYIHIDYSV
jgi:hypothetical protein